MPRTIKCSVFECWRKSSDPEKLTFHRFPADVDLCRKWLQNAGVGELTWLPEGFLTKSRYVCSLHFTPDSYRPGTNLLKLGSVPSVFERPVVPLTDEEVMVYPLNGTTAKRKKKDESEPPVPLKPDLSEDKVVSEVVTSINPGGTVTSEVVCNSPTFMEYLNTEAEDSGNEDLAEILESPEITQVTPITQEDCSIAVQADVSKVDPKDKLDPETIVLPDSLHYSFTITENLDIRLDVTNKPEPPKDLEYWKSCAERLKKENEALTAKVKSMQLVIDSLQKEVEARAPNAANPGLPANQCYFIDLTSAVAPILM